MARVFKVQVKSAADGKQIQALDFQGGVAGDGAKGRPLKISTGAGAQYELVDIELGRGPDRIISKRMGKDLHIAMEGGVSETPDLILVNYYENCTGDNACEVVGQGMDSMLGAYVPESGAIDAILTNLADSGLASQVLMNAPVVAATATGAGAAVAGLALSPLLGALGLVGTAAAAAAAKGGSGSADTTAPAAPVVNSPSNGQVISGTAEPGSKVVIRDRDGKFIASANVGADGKWSAVPAVKPVDGAITADSTDAAGNTSSPASGMIDGTAPDMPRVDSPSNGQRISGTAEPGSIVLVKDQGGKVIGSASVGPDGKWSVVPAVKPADGNITVDATDAAGNTSIPAKGAIDSTAPDAPRVHSPANGQQISGAAEPGSVVLVKDQNGNVIGSTTTGPDGRWLLKPISSIPDGTITATATDAAGNVSASAAGKIDSTPTTIAAPADNGGYDAQNPLSGTAPAGSLVVVTLPDGTKKSATAGADGKWSLAPADMPVAPLTDGEIRAVSQTPASGAPLGDYRGALVAKPYLAQLGALIPPDPNTGELDSGNSVLVTKSASGGTLYGGKSSLAEGYYFLSGTTDAPAGSLVKVAVIITSGGKTTEQIVIGKVDSNGTWTQVKQGEEDFGVLMAADPNASTGGSTSLQIVTQQVVDPDGSSSHLSFTPIIAQGASSGVRLASGSIALAAAEAVAEPTALAEPAPAPAVGTTPITQNVGRVEISAISNDTGASNADFITSARTQTITGVAYAQYKLVNGQYVPADSGAFAPIGSTIFVSVAGGEIRVARVGLKGVWTLNYTDVVLADGKHDINVHTFNFEQQRIEAPLKTIVIDSSAGISLDSGIAGDGVINAAEKAAGVTLGGSVQGVEPGQKVTVKVSDGTAVVTKEATVGADGKWSLMLNDADLATLKEGTLTVTAMATDLAGNAAPASSATVMYDVTAPSAPSKAPNALDDQGPVQGAIKNGDITDDAKPTFSGGAGSAEPGATVVVYDNDKPIGSTTVKPDGSWSFTPELPLGEGEHSVTTAVKDPAGNESAKSPALNFTVDSVAPTVPAITSIVDDVAQNTGNIQPSSVTNDKQPTVNGTGTPANVITIYDTVGGKQVVLGSTTVDKDGKWTFTVPADKALADGAHAITAQASNAAGAKSPETGVFGFTVDTAVPSQAADVTLNDDVGAVQGVIPANGTTDDNTPTLSGKAEPGATVIVSDNGKPIGSTTVKPDGSWSFTPSTPLVDGDHAIGYQVVDAAGNSSPASTPVPFKVDTSKVSEPTIVAVRDDAGNANGTVETVAKDGATNDNTPTITGTAPAGTTVTVYDTVNGTKVKLGETKADANGNWSLTVPADKPLADGKHSFSATATNAAGTVSPESGVYGINLDTVAPTKPAAPIGTDNVGTIQGQIPANGVTDDQTPVFSGKGTAGNVVTVTDDKGGVLGSVTVAADGTWSFKPATRLPEGPHSVTVTETDPAGNVSAPSAPLVFTVDVTAPTAPSKAPNALDDQGPVQGAIKNGDITDDAKPTFSGGAGSAEPGATVVVYDNGRPIGSATVKPDGSWSFTPELPLSEGDHSVTTSVKDPAGNESAKSPALDFKVDSQAPTVPAITSLVDDVPGAVGNIQPSSVTNDKQPTVNGTGTPGNVVTVLDTVGGKTVVLGSTTVDAQGKWTLTVPADKALADGAHAITAQAANAAGAKSPETGVFGFTVDTTAPSQAAGVTLTDDVGAVQGVVPANGTTDDSTPTLAGGAGSAEPGATVVVYDNGKPIGSTTVRPDGSWSFTPSTPLADGAHALSQQVVDAAGNSSPMSAPLPFTVNTSAVTGPAIVAVRDDVGNANGAVATIQKDGVTNDNTPTITGTAPAGTKVTVYDTVNGMKVKLGETTADASGNWSLTPAAPLADGKHSFSATATNAAGTVSPESGVYGINLDTVAPAKPTAPTGTDNVGTIQGQIPANGVTDDQTPVFSGKGTAGNVVTVTDDKGGVLGSVTVAADGTWSFKPATRLPEGPHSVTVTETDPAGNASAPSAPLVFTVDVTAPNKPGATPDMTPASDTGTSATDDLTNDATPSFAVPKPATGETPKLYVDGKPVDAVYDPVAGTLTPAKPLSDGPHDISYTLADSAGNESPQSAPLKVVIDTIAPDAPKAGLDAASDTGTQGDGRTTDDTPTISGTGVNGDKITVTLPTGEVLTATVSNGVWSVTPTKPLPEGSNAIGVTETDPAGNTSAPTTVNVVVDKTATDMTGGAVKIAADANNDGMLNAAELNGATTLNVDVTLPKGAVAGETLVLRDGSGKVLGEKVLAASDIVAGKVSFSAPVPAEGATLKVVVTVIDAAGNVSAPLSDSVIRDTTGTTAPTSVTITTDTNNDGFLNAAELGTRTTLSVDVGLPAGLSVGDRVVLRNADNQEIGTKTLTVTDLTAGKVVIAVAVPAEGQTLTVKAAIVDAAGNSSAVVSDSVKRDSMSIQSAGSVKITTDANDDGFINAAELGNSTTVAVEVTLAAGAVVGDRVVLRDVNDAVIGSVTLTAADIAAGKVGLSVKAPAEGATLVVAVSLVDAAGNVSGSATDSAKRDTTAGAALTGASIKTDVNNDGWLNAAELAGRNTVEVEALLPAGRAVGDKVVIRDASGKLLAEKTLTATDLTAGKITLTVPAPAEGTLLRVDATLVDAAGNVTSAVSDSATRDTVAPTAAKDVTITTDTNNDGVLNATELNGGNVLAVDVDLPAGVAIGDTVVLRNGAGALLGTHTVVAADVLAGKVTFRTNAPAEGATLSVIATIVDAAGNVSASATDSAMRVTIGGAAPTAVTISTDANNDGFISNAELNGANTVTVVIALPAGVVAGDIVRVTDGTVVKRVALDASMITAGKITAMFSAPAEGTKITVAATIINSFGNESAAARDSTLRDTIAPDAPSRAPDMTAATDSGGSNTDNLTNYSLPAFAIQAPTVGVTPVLYVDGAVVAATWNAVTGTLTPVRPITDGKHVIEYAYVDAAGNVSGKSPLLGNVVIDTVAPGAPVARLDVSSDTGVVGDRATTDRTPTISGAGTPGDLIRVQSPTGEVQWVTVPADGRWSVTLATPLNYGAQTVMVTAIDAAGNTSSATSQALNIEGTSIGGSISGGGVSVQSWQSVQVAYTDLSWSKFKTIDKLGWSGVHKMGVYTIINGREVYTELASTEGWIHTWNLGGSARVKGSFSSWAIDGCKVGGDALVNKLFHAWGFTEILGSNHTNTFQSESQWVSTGSSYDVTFADLASAAGGCYKLTFNGGSNYKVKTAGGAEIGRNADGTYTIDLATARNGVKLEVANGGSKPWGVSSTWVSSGTPMILDLDGDGVQTLGVEGGVTFDLLATGTKQKTGWVGKGDGLLVRDINQDGAVNDGAELFGEATRLRSGGNAKDGFAALADTDDNADGVINLLDSSFKELRVWIDANHDGASQGGELKTLDELGIRQLNLGYTEQDVMQNGNKIGMVSSYETADGRTLQMADVWFGLGAGPALLPEHLQGVRDGLLDLTDGQKTTLKLTVGDVLAAGTTDALLSGGKTQLVVTGDAADVVEVARQAGDKQWDLSGVRNVGGVDYVVYDYDGTNSGIELLVRQGIQADFI